MAAEQLDLFAGVSPAAEFRAPTQQDAPNAAALLDDALVAGLPIATLSTAPLLAAEAARRRLVAAVPALERLCRRLIGFGAETIVPEQAAALRALAVIGGGEAGEVVARLIVERVVQGPNLGLALDAAKPLHSRLPADLLAELLRHSDPAIRAGACHCVLFPAPVLIEQLALLLDDRSPAIAAAAACALGRLGEVKARPLLMRLLLESPSPEIIEAVAPIADRDTAVILRRIARTVPNLAAVAIEALDEQ
jgi:HEAT repeat protein